MTRQSWKYGVLLAALILAGGASLAVFGMGTRVVLNLGQAATPGVNPPAVQGPLKEPPEKTEVKPLAPLPIPVPQPVSSAVPAVKASALTLKIFDKDISLAGIPLLETEGGEVLLPLRRIGDGMGYAVKWDDSLKAAVLEKNAELITVKRDSREYAWGSVPRTLSRRPVMYQDRLYVPADFITDQPGLQLDRSKTAVEIRAAASESRQVLTGEITEVTAYSNGVALKVQEKGGTETLLYATDQTRITHYTSGQSLGLGQLNKGTRAIFSFTVVKEGAAEAYHLLKTIEVVADTQTDTSSGTLPPH